MNTEPFITFRYKAFVFSLDAATSTTQLPPPSPGRYALNRDGSPDLSESRRFVPCRAFDARPLRPWSRRLRSFTDYKTFCAKFVCGHGCKVCSSYCIMMCRTLCKRTGQPNLHLCATEAPACSSLPTLGSSVLVRPLERCTIDSSSAAEPEKASCS